MGGMVKRGILKKQRTSLLWGSQSTGTGCPGGLWSLLLWRYSKPTWTRSCAAWSRWTWFSGGGGLFELQRCRPTATILCDSVWFCVKRNNTLCYCSASYMSKKRTNLKWKKISAIMNPHKGV